MIRPLPKMTETNEGRCTSKKMLAEMRKAYDQTFQVVNWFSGCFLFLVEASLNFGQEESKCSTKFYSKWLIIKILTIIAISSMTRIFSRRHQTLPTSSSILLLLLLLACCPIMPSTSRTSRTMTPRPRRLRPPYHQDDNGQWQWLGGGGHFSFFLPSSLPRYDSFIWSCHAGAGGIQYGTDEL
jgi:hypothetical protein